MLVRVVNAMRKQRAVTIAPVDHRRLLLTDVFEYKKHRSAERNELLTELVQDAEEDGLYDIPAERYMRAIREARAESGGRG